MVAGSGLNPVSAGLVWRVDDKNARGMVGVLHDKATSSYGDVGGYQPLLTTQEAMVLAAASTGRNVSEVSELLGHHHRTVHQLLTSAMRKLGARSKLESIIVARQRGLIELP
jgi:DNA-binding NarL/FixJ family response regulator